MSKLVKVTAIIKFKHGVLLDALRRLNLSTCAFADKAKVNRGSMCHYVNLELRPSLKTAVKIISTLAELGEVLSLEELWPTEFQPSGASLTVEQSAEISPLLISDYARMETDRLLAQSNPLVMPEEVQSALDSLSRGQRQILNDRADGMTWVQLAEKHGVSRERIRMYHDELLRRVRQRMHTAESLLEAGVTVTPSLLSNLGRNPFAPVNAFEPKPTQ